MKDPLREIGDEVLEDLQGDSHLMKVQSGNQDRTRDKDRLQENSLTFEGEVALSRTLRY